MMRTRSKVLLTAAMAILFSGHIVCAQDVLTTLEGLRVEGKITQEDEEKVMISTKYGDLRFLKMNLKTIERGGNRAAPVGGNSGGMGMGNTGNADPFGGSGSADPFGGGGNAGNADPFGGSGSADPFGGGGNSGSADPFGGSGMAEFDTGTRDAFGGNSGSADPFGGSGSSGSADPFGGGGNTSGGNAGGTPPAGGTGFGGYGIPMSQIQGGGGGGFGAPSGGGNASNSSPFGGGGAADPFGGGLNRSGGNPDAFNTPSGGTTTDPFGGPAGTTTDPFGSGPSSGEDPFSYILPDSNAPPEAVRVAAINNRSTFTRPPLERRVYASYGDNEKAEEAAADESGKPQAPVVKAAASGAKLPAFGQKAERPDVDEGYDGVVYGISEAMPVSYRLGESADWSALVQTTQLRMGSEIKTDETNSSRMVLRGKKDELRLPRQSHIIIERLSDDSEEVIINLMAGSIWSEVTPRSKPDAFQVRTPELTAGVRGTNFRVDRANNSSKVSVFEGVVHVTANKTGASVTLRENEAAVVNLHGQILDLIAVPVDEQAIHDDWQAWASEATYGSASLAASFSPVGSLGQQIAQDNAQWEASMQEYMRNTAELKYLEKIDEYAAAFMRYARDTGHYPEADEAWSELKFDTGREGWNGPYVEGPIPPIDPWKNALVYRKETTPGGRLIGRVYSMWEDKRDQGGVNASLDKGSIIRYFEIEEEEK